MLLLTFHVNKAGLILLGGVAATLILFWLLRWSLARHSHSSFTDFFVGDTGKLSIARLQAVGWAFFIIGFQVSVILALWLNPVAKVQQFNLQFSNNILWLLGLSMGSYVAVKGITVTQINQNQKRFKSHKAKPSDLITGDNGLDFSKFQMLIWTLIAMIVYLTDCFHFIEYVYTKESYDEIGLVFNSANEDTWLKNIPDIDDSFIILMGLSQGVYVGKKMIPTFKLDSAKQDRKVQLELLKTELTNKKQQYENILQNVQDPPATSIGKQQLDKLKEEIKALETKIAETEAEINQIQQYQAA